MMASGAEYVKQAYLCAKSIRETQTINNVSLLTNDTVPQEYKSVFDKIIEVPNSQTDFYRTDFRWKVFHITPYDETIVLDTDMIFLTDVSHWWNYLRKYDICFTKNTRTYRNTLITNNYYRKAFEDNYLPNIYCAFHYFKKTDIALNYYLKLKQICKNYKEFYKIYVPKQTPKLSSMDINHAITVLDQQIENYIFEPASFVHMKSNVQDWKNPTENWTDTIPFYFSQDFTLKVGNYLQHGIFHYTENSFCNTIIQQLGKQNEVY